MYLLFKALLSAAVIPAVSEIAKRNTLFGALIASLPLTSVLAMIWLYQETKDTSRVADLSGDIFWLVLPSLLLLLVLRWRSSSTGSISIRHSQSPWVARLWATGSSL